MAERIYFRDQTTTNEMNFELGHFVCPIIDCYLVQTILNSHTKSPPVLRTILVLSILKYLYTKHKLQLEKLFIPLQRVKRIVQNVLKISPALL